jgi:6-phosphogluconate dehydrogenase
MKLGLIGLGKMGGNMVKRLKKDNHNIVAFDLKKENVDQAVIDGAEGAESIEDLIRKLPAPRNIWVMVPHGDPTEKTISKLLESLNKNDLIVDGGNSNYKNSMENGDRCRQKGIKFVDCGVSGGVWGLKIGYNLMVGGSEDDYKRMEPIFKSLAPENGYALVGKNGAGHFVKMIHNALEYVMLEGIGEAFECMHKSDFNINLQQVAGLWNNGSVVRSWLIELAAKAFKEENNDLKKIAPYVDDSGTARWTTDYAVENAVPVPTITMSLYKRFASRLDEPFSDKVIAALRNQFGGHAVKEELTHGR